MVGRSETLISGDIRTDPALRDNTIVVICSDNGPEPGAGSAGPFRGHKTNMYEGGIRTPLFMRWPGGIAPGTQRADVTGHLDIFSTIAAAAGAAVPRDRTIDSENILAGPASRAAMFWRSGDYRVVRAGDWKLQVNEKQRKAWLYNLAADPTETTNLIARNPAKRAELEALLAAHHRGRTAPLYPSTFDMPVMIDRTLADRFSPEAEYIYWPN